LFFFISKKKYSMMLVKITLILLFCSTSIVSRSITASVRNEFGTDLQLTAVQLDAGNWSQPPLKSISSSSTYQNGIWKVEGTFINGWVKYETSDGYAHAQFFFTFDAKNKTFSTEAGPSPFIGGVGPVTGTTDLIADFWVHQMCVVRSEEKCISGDY
jgi:hypothetical protein